ncbi:CobW family GTP-binding protein [Paenibacillus lautus]|uniref:GTP-binding protein n=1 Tax=Paenibacillus lautus TaxID=1401 RepID=A0A385TL88_PAELA|nr:GTP-binding protein [Paenibacillus lautus]AYB43768.1 GTP-binding protein [Paenibacillus lautus]
MNKIPVVLISGFLGSGKTTLLLRLLAYAAKRQWRTAVLMNEMGEQDVDGDILSGEMPDLPIEKLLDGCICCTKRDELGQALKSLLDRKPDLVFIETTGVANPEQILEDLQDPSLVDRITIRGKIALADCSKFLEYNSFFASSRELVRTLRGQISFADWIILNKAGECEEKQINKVITSIRKINTTASLSVTDYSRLDEHEMFAALQLQQAGNHSHSSHSSNRQESRSDRLQGSAWTGGEDRSKPGHRDHEGAFNHNEHRHGHVGEAGHGSHSYTGLDTLTLSAPTPFPLEISLIETFLAARGSGLLRAKGYIQLSTGPSLVQWAGSQLAIEPSTLKLQRGYLTLIGHRLDKTRIVQEWEDLLSGVVQ